MNRGINKRIKLLSGIAAALMLMAFVISCKSNISMPKVAVMGITLDKTKLSLEEAKTEKLTATVLPENATNKKITWHSDKPEVADVGQDGTVTAKKAGTANITVKTEDGDKTAVCAVTVKAKTPQPVQKYTVTLTQPVHGSVTTDPAILTDKQVVEGTEITFTAKADAGYHVDTWSITGGALQSGGQPGNTTATVKITTNTTVQVTFKKQDPMGTYVTVPFGANGETLNTYLKDSASEANINYIKVTGLTKEKLRGSYPNTSELGEILKKHPGKKVALTFDDAEIAGLTDMRDCFYGCTDLTQAPQIPTSATDMWKCFKISVNG